ncbi:hypothetical protein FOMPIDRAFT_114852 [Fomitopsis schrenkii]|uniref:HBS1-like protein N-terminal domain-containing protein n=1 Tax=Fomitopsis schrenkii TaxID=2126942 RepID=S8FX26_FOMSC|nr:hypothetical protein FOMPIDRAFT_114852 [Fomitopsis schrenkii]
MDPEEYDRLMEGLEQVRIAIGSPEQSGFSDQEIKDALYYYQYDADKSVNYLIEEQDRKRAAQERKDPVEKPLPPIPQDDELGSPGYQPVYPGFVSPAMSGRSNIPLIRLAQMQPEDEIFEYSEDSIDAFPHTTLSTIEEKTERSESESRTRSPPEPVPAMESIPDIPSIMTKKSALKPASEKKSKLSSLASSRSLRSSASSISSRSYNTDGDDQSLVTYPGLRPSAASVMSVPFQVEEVDDTSTVTGSSSMSSHVRRAIATALELEAVDRATGDAGDATPRFAEATPQAPETAPSQPSPAPTRIEIPSPPPLETPKTPKTPRAPHRISPAVTATRELSLVQPPSPPPPRDAPQSPMSPQINGKQPSKLAMLAQAKAAQQQGPWMPKAKKPSVAPAHTSSVLNKTHTEYMQPIANGATATTAITTSYQTLGSLMSRDRSALPPSIPPAGRKPDALSPRSSGTKEVKSKEAKPSKLAMKSKATQRKAEREREPEPVEESIATPLSPLFSPQVLRARAAPSTFAAVLVDDNGTLIPVEGADRKHTSRSGKSSGQSRRSSSHRHSAHSGSETSKRSSKHDSLLPPAPELASLRGFAFDIPSPDDVVFNARRGTSLATRSVTSASPLPRSPPSGRSSHSRSIVDAAAS